MKTMLCFAVGLSFLLFSSVSFVPTAGAEMPADHTYRVVINHEEQYSIRLADAAVPKGWKDTGVSGSLDRCQAYLREVWTDMRPLSIRKMDPMGEEEYRVVINHEEQYSIWPADRPTGKKWEPTGPTGSLEKCTQYIREVWTDMRPLSLRRRLRGERRE